MNPDLLIPDPYLFAEQASTTPGQTTDVRKAREVAEDFEAVFLSQMMEPMFKGISTDGIFGGGQGDKIFRSLLIQEYGKIMARAGGVGLADAVMKQILKAQEMP